MVKFIDLKPEQPIQAGDYKFTPYRVRHSVPAAGFLIESQKRDRVFCTGDTGLLSSTWKKLKGRSIDCLIIEVSFPERMEKLALKTGHLTPGLLKGELKKMNPLPRKIYVTHLKPPFVKTIKEEILGLGVRELHLLRDGDTIRI